VRRRELLALQCDVDDPVVFHNTDAVADGVVSNLAGPIAA
jgi:hypothetical protein